MSVIGPRPWRPVRRGLAVGVVLACLAVAVLAVLVTREAGPGGPERGTERTVLAPLGVEVIAMTRTNDADAGRASLSLRPGSALLLLLPLAGAGAGALVARRADHGA
jgi:hypothetical protein